MGCHGAEAASGIKYCVEAIARTADHVCRVTPSALTAPMTVSGAGLQRLQRRQMGVLHVMQDLI